MKKVLSVIICILVLISTAACMRQPLDDSQSINREEYNQLEIGMYTIDVMKIVGTYGEEISAKEENSKHIVVYKIDGEKSGYATLTFENLQLKEKEQTDLE